MIHKKIQMAVKHMKRCSISLVTIEIQVKRIMANFLSIRLPKMVDFLPFARFGGMSTFRYSQWEYKLVQPVCIFAATHKFYT